MNIFAAKFAAMENKQEEYSHVLSEHNIRPTALRIMVYRTIEQFHDTFSLADVQDALETLDPSTIFRALTLFAENGVVHVIEDGSGSTKYCFCHCEGECSVESHHCHFYCESCHRTICFHNTRIPIIPCPEGFQMHDIEYLIKGICPECGGKK